MEYVGPPFRIDVAGAFLLPQELRDAQAQYRNEQISRVALRAIEDTEIRNLVDRLKAVGLRVVTDGGFRNISWPLDFMCNLEGIQSRGDHKSGIELIGRVDFHHHPVLDDFMYLTGVTGGDVIAKQVLPAPSLLLSELLKDGNSDQLSTIYPDEEELLTDIALTYQKLIQELYESGCRYLQFDDVTRVLTSNAIQVNNLSLEGHPEDLFIAFHASAEMLYSVEGVNSFLLDYDDESCGKSSLLWFIREQKATFGFIPSHYPLPSELDEIYEAIDEVTPYISLERLSLCVPNAQVLPNEDYDTALMKQWSTLDMAMIAAKALWSDNK
ncbi:uroporphyrinogen decarboxylase/cobalamine-independent methonine synthase family protein [Bacteroides ihuae]|uniref:methionine synthase n=1 Tax=Bacteroides ihuae TaxID=1852362 RepID=UPI0008D967CD|nr:methionine synthase [Bacteroides ihuae]